jgi:hypothetical protein
LVLFKHIFYLHNILLIGKNPALKSTVPSLLFTAFVLVMIITIRPMNAYFSVQEVDGSEVVDGVGSGGDGVGSSDGSSIDNGAVNTGQDEEPSRSELEPGIAPAPGPDPEGLKESPADIGPPVCIDVFPPPPGCGSDGNEPPVEDGPPVCIDVFPAPPSCGEPPDDDCLFDPSLPKC